ncbi:hypothetical protein SUGI_1207930 [Cryptomeria japonica]|uniref:Bulb-type lectin domain-containing protein n=1 Tax=Cryptomeria japonica TaxID=3369 RepID=A0AAD3NJ32_CRYJA|nr:hypothetical protein SUGI_1207930 [Cryptomeria japonica]
MMVCNKCCFEVSFLLISSFTINATCGISTVKCMECFILIILVQTCECSGDVLTLGGINQTVISEKGTFALGFFNPNGRTNLYVGIWYAQIPVKTAVWVANIEAPL